MKLTVVLSFAAALVIAAAPSICAEDWPQWRYDASHSADSPEELPPDLSLQWTRQYTPRTQVWEDPLNQDLMAFDRVFEPVVLGHRMFLGFNDRDKVVALDLETGQELWTFFTDGPVCLPPAAGAGKVYFACDDGYLYCLQAEDGALVWKFRGGPSGRKVLGNSRLISAWPARGGPVLRDGRVYFAASIWPFMGTFIYALDALTGKVEWVNDGTGFQYIKQPHSAPSFAGVAPQGLLTATRDFLLVPGGRSVPAGFDRKTGRFVFYQLEDSGKGNGGWFVAAGESEYFVHTRDRGTRGYDLKTGKKGAFTITEPVLTTNYLYASQESSYLKAAVADALQKLAAAHQAVKDAEADLVKAQEDPATTATAYKKAADALVTARKKIRPAERTLATAQKTLSTNWAGCVIQAVGKDKKVRWELKADGSGDLIKAGRRLYAAGTNSLIAVQLPATTNIAPQIVWSNRVEGQVKRLLAAHGQLFAVTLEGRILAFGSEQATEPRPSGSARTSASGAPQPLTGRAPPREGYALWFGLDDGRFFEAVVRVSQLHVIGIDPDPAKIDLLRRHFDAAGLYGARLALHAGEPLTFQAPPYLASLIVVGDALAPKWADPRALKVMYESLRPYGGTLRISTAHIQAPDLLRQIEAAGLPKARVSVTPEDVLVRREGALPGAASWTHQYADVANTVKSEDQLVKLPLGLLWFGGNSHADVLPRHGHGPSEQIAGGRLFIEGLSCLSARDVYTGRLLWKTDFDDLGNYGVYYDATYTNLPLSTIYNQKHIPGANARGANFVVTEDWVYVVASNACLVLEAATGNIARRFRLPPRAEEAAPPDWGYVGVYEDLLLAGEGLARYTRWLQLAPIQTPTLAAVDLTASRGLAALDRHTGRVLWRADARYSFPHQGIVAGNGRIYCLDKIPKSIEARLKRRGRHVPADYRVAAFAARTGALLWETTNGVTATWLSYSKDHDVLLLAGASAADRLKDEADKGLAALRGKDGAVLWQKPQLKYTGPCILYKDLILTTPISSKTNAGAFGLLDGHPRFIKNPLTRQSEPWRIYRNYGCNYPVACEHLVTFRSGAAGYYDLEHYSGTGNFGGYKSSCSPNLLAADGVLNSPDYTRTCSCPYQNQTSLALVHTPELETWTHSEFGSGVKEGLRLERVGINFGAPGDRLAENGTLWLDHPSVGGNSPYVRVVVKGARTNYFRRYSAAVTGDGPAWVMASGVREAESIVISAETRRPPPARAAPKKKTEDEEEEDKDNGNSTSKDATDSATSTDTAKTTGASVKGKTETSSSTATNETETASADASPTNQTETASADASLTNQTETASADASPTNQTETASDASPTNSIAALTNASSAATVSTNAMSTNKPERVYISKLTPAPYTVRLYFADPDALRPGERVFDVSLQGRRILRNFDLIAEAGGSLRGLVKEYQHILIKDQLAIALNRAAGAQYGPVICGVELLLEEKVGRDGQ